MLAYKTVSGKKSFKKLVHLSLQFLALCLSIIGLWAALKFHINKGIYNFVQSPFMVGLSLPFAAIAEIEINGILVSQQFNVMAVIRLLLQNARWFYSYCFCCAKL
ncbi:hypothetical protein U1Q18_025135 [Sarracenia purpurea var. burkii]